MKILEEERKRFNLIPTPLQPAIIRHLYYSGDLTESMDKAEEVAAQTLENMANEE